MAEKKRVNMKKPSTMMTAKQVYQELSVPTISTGEPSTLKTYRKIARALSLSEDSPAVKFFDDKIAEQGEDEVVLADEGQMMVIIGSMVVKGFEAETKGGERG